MESTTIPIKAVTRSGFGMNPEHRRMFIEKQIRDFPGFTVEVLFTSEHRADPAEPEAVQ